jgi:hypothetical protein
LEGAELLEAIKVRAEEHTKSVRVTPIRWADKLDGWESDPTRKGFVISEPEKLKAALAPVLDKEIYNFEVTRLRPLTPNVLVEFFQRKSKSANPFMRLVFDVEHGFVQQVNGAGDDVGFRLEVPLGFTNPVFSQLLHSQPTSL